MDLKGRKKMYRQIFIIVGLILSIIMGFMVRNSSQGIFFDIVLLDYIHGFQNEILFNMMKFISFIGSFNFLLPALLVINIYLLRKKDFYPVKLLISNSLGSWILNYLIKGLVNRTRPLDYFLVEQGGLSFPSGHSMVTMSLYLTIAYLTSKRYPKKQSLIFFIAIILVFIMGFSRLYLGVHWPTDVIAGFIIGFVFWEACISLIKP